MRRKLLPPPDADHPWPDPAESGIWRWARWAYGDFFRSDRVWDILLLPLVSGLIGVFLGPRLPLPDDWNAIAHFLLAAALVPILLYVVELILAPFGQRIALRQSVTQLRSDLSKAIDRTLNVSLVGNEVALPGGWPVPMLAHWGPYRLTVVLLNRGLGAFLEAVVRPGILGLDPASVEGTNPLDYGDFNLQWDLTPSREKWIPKDGTWKLHVLAGKEGQIAFLGPPEVAYNYKGLRVLDSVSFRIEVREYNTDNYQSIPVRVGFSDRKPVVLDPL